MADRLLWEDGSGILLEDASGDIALEFDSPSLQSLTNLSPSSVRPLQSRSGWQYQVTRAIGPWAPDPVFPFPRQVRPLQTRSGWQYQVIKSIATPPASQFIVPWFPAGFLRPLQTRTAWHLTIKRDFAAAPIPAPIDTTAVVVEDPIGDFWDVPPYPRQQPRVYVAHHPSAAGARFQANLYRTPSASISMATGIPLAAAARDIRSFTPGTLISSISLAASLGGGGGSMNPALTTGIRMTAALGDNRRLTVFSFQPRFTAALTVKVRKFTPDLVTNIPLVAQAAAASKATAALSTGIQFASAAASSASLSAPLVTSPTLVANLTSKANLPRLALSLQLTTGIPLAAIFRVRSRAAIPARYLLEDGSGYYQLEDGSGVMLLEGPDNQLYLATGIPLMASLASQAQSTANLATGIALAAAIGNIASLSTSLLSSLPAQMVAAMVAGAAATPTLSTGISLGTVPMRSVSQLTAALNTAIPLGTSPADIATVTALLSTAISLGSVPGADTAQLIAAFTNVPRLAANPSAQAQLQGALTTLIRFAASSRASASLMASALSKALGPSQTGTNNIVYAPAVVTTVYAPAMIVYGIPID